MSQGTLAGTYEVGPDEERGVVVGNGGEGTLGAWELAKTTPHVANGVNSH